MTISPDTIEGQARQQAKDVHARLWGRPTSKQALEPSSSLFVRSAVRPGANLPRNGTTTHYRKQRAAVEFTFAVQLVCEDRGLTPDQIMNSTYCAAVAARHMLWTVLFDGGYGASDIARRFVVDHRTVTLGIASFREFQAAAL